MKTITISLTENQIEAVYRKLAFDLDYAVVRPSDRDLAALDEAYYIFRQEYNGIHGP